MGYRRTLCVASWMTVVSGLLLSTLLGCAMVPPNSFIDPTKVGRFGGDAHEGGIRRILTPRDTPPGLAHATEPTPEDLVAVYQEYRLEPSDTVAVTVQDLLVQGMPYSAVLEVNPLGEIRLPELGVIKVAGLTEAELEQEIKAQLIDGGLLPRPIVLAFTQSRRGRIMTFMGAVGAPGPYPIMQPDLRLLEAIGMVGDASASARELYVIRQTSAGRRLAADESLPVDSGEDAWVIPPPADVEQETPEGLMSMVGYNQDPSQVQSDPAEPASAPSREELADVMSQAAEAPPTSETRAAMTMESEPGTTEGRLEPLVFFDPETGQMLEVEQAPAEAEFEPRADADDSSEDYDEPFDWDDVEDLALEQRVIAIDLAELRAGNPRYNIVIRNRDVINVPIDTGVFYIMGEVLRPGVYAFGGREITIKQAMAICGGFSAMAWPQRCEVTRREPGTDKQIVKTVNLDAIFAGLEDDFYLRDDDEINVGTHIIAPFLFVIRNSFRFTYGFGFVYDRNFADKDSFGSRINPEIQRAQERSSRGLSF